MDRERIEEPFGPVAVKHMFGGHGIFVDALIFAIEAYGRIYLKVDEFARPRFVDAGSEPFVYSGRSTPVAMSCWRLPDEALEDEYELRRWSGLALTPREEPE